MDPCLNTAERDPHHAIPWYNVTQSFQLCRDVPETLFSSSKVIVPEGVAIPARSEMVIEGKIQAKDISQVGMISASQADSIRRLQGLHVAHLVVTPAGKTVPVRIANTTSNQIELPAAN